MNVQSTEFQPSTSGGAKSQKRVGDTGTRSVTESSLLGKLTRQEALNTEEMSEVKHAMAALNKRKVESEKEERDGIRELQTKAGVLQVNDLPPITTTEIQEGNIVAVYSATGEPVFRLFDDDGKYVVFKRVSDSPYFEQLSTDETVAWSKIFYKNVNYGVKSNSCLGRIGHARTQRECNVKIIPACKPEDVAMLNDIISTPKRHGIIEGAQQICSMALFSEFMEKVEMDVIATRKIAPCSPLRMDYGYDPGKENPDNVAAVSKESKERIEQELNEHAKEAEEMKVPSYWTLWTSETLEESDKESNSDAETIILPKTSLSEPSQTVNHAPDLSSFQHKWESVVSEFRGLDVRDNSLIPFVDSLSINERLVFEALALFSCSGFDETDERKDSAIQNIATQCQPGKIIAESSLEEMRDMLYKETTVCFELDTWEELLVHSRKRSKSQKRTVEESDDDPLASESSQKKQKTNN